MANSGEGREVVETMSELYSEWEKLWQEYADANRGDIMQVNWVGVIARDAFEAGYLAGRKSDDDREES